MLDGENILTGEVHTDGNSITYVGDATDKAGEDAKAAAFDREIDCGGNLLMPGFKNAHTHSGMTFLRSSADDLPLDEWLNTQVFPYEAKLTADDIYKLTRLAILEYLSGGTTAVMEMYLTPESIAKAANEMGFRMVQVGGVNNFSQSVELIEKYYNTLNGVSDLTSFAIGIHAEYTCSRELIGEIAALAAKYRAPVYAHISETAKEVEEFRGRYGMSPVAFLASEGLFDYGGAGYHLVHTDAEDIRILKERGIGVVTNPGSNTKLASGIAPISDYLEAGLTIAIGTDGPASNNCLDMFREMFLTTGLAKLRENSACAVPAFDVLTMATRGGAQIMGLPETDAIAPGKKADIILLDLMQPNMQPLQNIPRNIVYSGSKSNVLMTMVGGSILYERRENIDDSFHVGESASEIFRAAQEVRDRILG